MQAALATLASDSDSDDDGMDAKARLLQARCAAIEKKRQQQMAAEAKTRVMDEWGDPTANATLTEQTVQLKQPEPNEQPKTKRGEIGRGWRAGAKRQQQPPTTITYNLPFVASLVA